MVKLYFATFCVSLMLGLAVVITTPAAVTEQHIIALIGGTFVWFGNFIAICLEATL